MDCSTLWIYALIYLIAGIVILKSLGKLNMRVASVCFGVLFAVGLLYIPFIYGSEFFVSLIRPIFEDIYDMEYFLRSTRSPLIAYIPYFSVTSIVTVVIAVIVGIAALLLTVKAVRYVVRRIRVRHEKKLFVYRKKPVFPVREVRAKPKRIYLSLCRLLN